MISYQRKSKQVHGYGVVNRIQTTKLVFVYKNRSEKRLLFSPNVEALNIEFASHEGKVLGVSFVRTSRFSEIFYLSIRNNMTYGRNCEAIKSIFELSVSVVWNY